ncbi:MAG: hypothetical protein ACTHM1_03425 [Solirubrobacteraceae bacterium]
MTSVDTLIEALPYIREFRGERFVIRCPAQLDEARRRALSRDIGMLRFVGVKVVLVHPAGSPFAERNGVVGGENHSLVHAIGEYGKATGLAGSDGAPRYLLSLSSAGEVEVDPDLVLHVIDDYTPVIEAVAVTPSGDAAEADPDLAAARLAVALGAYKVLFVVGDHRVRAEEPEESGEISEMRASDDIVSLARMDPELKSAFRGAIEAVRTGQVKFGHLIPYDHPHGMLLELFTDRGYGTKIRSQESWREAEVENPEKYTQRGYFCWRSDPQEEI